MESTALWLLILMLRKCNIRIIVYAYMHLLIFFSLLKNYCNFDDENCHFFEKKMRQIVHPSKKKMREEMEMKSHDQYI